METLLNLDGEVFPMENGYWIKFEARRVPVTKQIPHGIRYCLTLHDRNNTRLIGFDNAHAYQSKKKKYSGRKITWDHQHKLHKIYPYEFDSAGQLLEDFWNAVEQII